MNLAEKELQAEKALRWLHGEAEQVGRDAAAVEYLDEFRKVELARIKNLAFEAESDAAKTAGSVTSGCFDVGVATITCMGVPAA